MRLKEIKLAGFKSFVDPTSVVLPGNRNAVVGPNGCGKSNIIDAVRWVMGESSARQLRGDALTDVIFNGSSARQPTSLASIELVFDNRDDRVGGKFARYAEIAIRREVSRESQSTYFLNGARCRRRDIADVFLGTGFGPRSYAIIEQGMISQLVEAKPEELRGYLEEAAGISKYRERRRETQNRIRHAKDNLERLTDIRDELGKQLAHLKRQAKAAERYRELKSAERETGAQLCALRINAVAARLAEREAGAAALEVDLAKAQGARQAAETALEKSRAAHGEQTDALAEAQGRYYQLGADAKTQEEAMGLDRERIAQLEENLSALATRQRDTASQLEADGARIDDLERRLEASRPALAESESAAEAAAARLPDLEQGARSQDRDWEDHARRANENDGEARVCADRIEQAQRTIARLEQRLAKLDAAPAPPADAGDQDDLARRVAQAERRVAQIDAAIAANGEAMQAARQEVAERETALAKVNGDLEAKRREAAALEAVQGAALGRADAGAGAGAEQWLEEKGLRDAPRLGEGLTVADGWERAVEMALDGHLRAIPAPSAAAFAAELDELDGGRLAFVDAERAGQSAKGPLPPLADLVRQPLGGLAAGVFAAKSVGEALAHRGELAPGQSIVTRDGLWLGVDWLRWDRGARDSVGVIERTRALATAGSAIAAAIAAAERCAARLDAGRAALAKLEEEREAARRSHAEAAAALARLASDRQVRRVRAEEAEARAQRMAAERQGVQAEMEAATRHLADCEARRAKLVADAEALKAQGDGLRATRERAAERLAEARAEAAVARETFHRQRAECQALDATLGAAQTTRGRQLEQRRELAEQAAELRRSVAAVQAALPAKQESLQASIAKRLVVERELVEMRRAAERIEAEIRVQTGHRAQAERNAEKLREDLQAVRVERERLAANRDNLQSQLDETGIALADAAAGLPSDASEAQWEEALARIARRIERLGPINLAAIDEYETQSERKRHLDAQHEDLQTALDTLHKAIARIDRETRRRFQDTFNQVNKHLAALFPKVFGGGRAALALAGEDWLDTGVTFMARPPGKRNASIHLLSGGEKAMAALALVFSIFQLNPSPVCLLDEVDAPLDDVNVERFADLIREMSRDVQFVVVTHNKHTIEMADHLLGVTMQEAGVSRLVSVDVDKAARMAAAG